MRQSSRDEIDSRAPASTAALLSAIVNSSDDAIVGKTADGVITSWNPAAERMYGYSASEIIGRPITVLCPPDRVGEITGILDRIGRGERVVHHETVRRRKDGTDFPVSVTISPVYDDGGRLVGASSIARDLTERKHLEAERAYAADLARINRPWRISRTRSPMTCGPLAGAERIQRGPA